MSKRSLLCPLTPKGQVTLGLATGTLGRALGEPWMCPLQFGEHHGPVSTSCLRNRKGQSWQKWPEHGIETVVGEVIYSHGKQVWRA